MVNKILEILDDCIECDCNVQITGKHSSTIRILELLTLKLKWKVEQIRDNGGDNLICIQHVLQQAEFRVVINDYGSFCSVIWNSVCLFDGKLEECKQFCTDKILNDFLKLCE